ncbi:MAG: hypothetical protein Q8Q58_12355 [Candidatus Rokubacteria bacterium]|nr:hypothetical protein [Candidatus Rokubacteria bacterium]
MTRRHLLCLLAAGLGAMFSTASPASADDRTRTFSAPADRVWTVARSTLESLGWKIDKEDRDVGWVVTKSRGVDHDDYGVYAKGTRHRLRVMVKGREGGKTEVTVERRLWKEERILWMDKEEELNTTDRTVEKQVLDAIGKGL